MRESFGTIVALILVVIGMFLDPMLNNATKQDAITQDYVYTEVVQFVQDVQLNGYISQDRYNEFTTTLSDTNNMYDIEIEHVHDVVMPVFNDRGNAIQGTKTVKSIRYEDDVLEEIYSTGGIYYLEEGDQFTVTVKNKTRTLGQKLNSVLANASTKYAIVATYGATIRNENY